tara:strand:- start:291 stop:1106 length:816 start_codon:yes stop_codon:yes gene_type:complete
MLQGSDGFVGLGINAPLDLLHLRGGGANDSAGAPIIRMQKLSGGAVDDGQTIGGMSFGTNDDGVDSGAYKERAKIIAESQNTSSGTRLEFWTGNSNAAIAERVRIVADGTVVAPIGVCLGTAIDGAAAANTLDDYEEGTWTPALTFGGNAVSLATSTNVGFYTKIGNFVHICFRTVLSDKGSSSGNAAIGGLPFTVGNSTGNFGGANINFSQNWTNDDPTPLSGEHNQLVMDSNTVLIQFRRIATNGGFNSTTNAHFTNTTDLIITGQYRV